MNPSNIFTFALLIITAVFISSCDKSGTATVTTGSSASTASRAPSSPDHGAWLGEGTFAGQQGTQQIKAQLELLADGTYRFAVIEPRALMMIVGLEKGKWTRTSNQLNLVPTPDQRDTPGNGTSLLGPAPRNYSPKSLTVNGNTFLLQDARMNLQFNPNPKATQKLIDRGEI